jgi:hypothetical protein
MTWFDAKLRDVKRGNLSSALAAASSSASATINVLQNQEDRVEMNITDNKGKHDPSELICLSVYWASVTNFFMC